MRTMKTTSEKKNTNVVRGTVNTARRIGHLHQKSSSFRSKKWYDRKEGKRVEY